MLTDFRKEVCTTIGNHLLDSIFIVSAFWVGKLYQHSHSIQSATSTRANGLEDAGGVHCGIGIYRCDVRVVSLYECGEKLNASITIGHLVYISYVSHIGDITLLSSSLFAAELL